MAEPATFWNGEPTPARRLRVVVADSVAFPHYWARHLVGTVRRAVRVDYQDQSFYLDDEDGSGWLKVTDGLGSPHVGHRGLEVQTIIAGA